MIGVSGALHLLDLTNAVQNRMLVEWQREENSGNPYRSPRLTAAGIDAFLAAMPEALLHDGELGLADALAHREYWKGFEHRISSRGRWIAASMPRNVNVAFAKTEYLTWYTRGLAGHLLDEGYEEAVIYRAAPAWQPRCECLSLEGSTVKTIDVYNGHRARYWPIKRPRAFSIPVGTNCHHTITRVRRES